MEDFSGELIVAMLALAGTVVASTTALLVSQSRTHKLAKLSNEAVNDNQPGQPTLYGMVAHLYSRNQKFEELLNDLIHWRTVHDKHLEDLEQRLEILNRRLD